MESASIGLATAFVAGLVSFLSPCVLPLIPAYLSFMTGLTASELGKSGSWKAVLPSSLLFVGGFSAVFVALGASASVLGSLLIDYRAALEVVAGALIVVFGVFMLGVLKLPWLHGEARFDMGRSRSFGRGAAFVMGAAFAFGWTPCVGPVLGAILALAGVSSSVWQGAALLSVFSLGLGIPFVVVGLLFGRLAPALARLNRHAVIVNRVAGVLLIAIGLLIATGRMAVFVGILARVIPQVPTG